ncbi:FUSC family protein [Streptomyces sp. NPDC006975]|uniref:FUSC family protein n=1 Tax=Streptomyces sp. NPDC006975 TaxID=3154310 RepID=UPI003453DB95
MFRRTAPAAALPPWLAHAFRGQRGPVPWNAVVRGALAAGPLLVVALGLGRTGLGVVAAIGAMFAGINDRPGSRRAAVRRIGVPALAGAMGLVVGTYGAQYAGAVLLTLGLAALGLLAGGVGAVGPVASAAGTQLLVASAVGAGMPLAESGWLRGLGFLGGAGWLLVLRLALPSPGAVAGEGRLRSAGRKGRFGFLGREIRCETRRPLGRLDFRFDGERDAVARVYDAVAALLDAAGGPSATARRIALTAALDHAEDCLSGPRVRRYASSAAERRLHAQYGAALPLAEAATALAWAGEPVGGRAGDGVRRLAAAVRDNVPVGPVPAPGRSAPALRALDDALLRAAEVFDRGHGTPVPTPRRSTRQVLRLVLGSGGREYGVRVALSFGVAVAVAQALHHLRWYGPHSHWYWLPATAVFLVKPDLGPLASRVLCRAAGTVLGAVAFAALAAVLPRPAGLVVLVAVCGALVPVATRHFAAQTAVVTVLVLALVMVGGEPQASWSRLGETLLACAIVLVVGHLPVPGQRGGGVRDRLAVAAGAADAYLTHVLTAAGPGSGKGAAPAPPGPGGPGSRPVRWVLRREAYRTLAEARAASALAAAELPPLARHSAGSGQVAAVLEELVDTATACAVQLDDTGRLSPRHERRLAELLGHLSSAPAAGEIFPLRR